MTKNKLAGLPSVDRLLQRTELEALLEDHSRKALKTAIQEVLVQIRQGILKEDKELPEDTEIIEMIQNKLEERSSEFVSLKRVVNGTGTIVHTNLGRSCLASSIAESFQEIAFHYSNLEYDLKEGRRGSRYDHIRKIVQELTGAEDALVVNNNAAAVFLVLNTLAKGTEVLVSRGELVEIGGAFRIPDVINHSGGTIKEVGTTNKTHLVDYQEAIDEETGAIMKVHTSNYRIVGFTESVEYDQLAKLAHEHGLPFINDLGSGLLIDLQPYGLPYEPTVKEVLAKGTDIVTFSGDKLLGGPQAGIIAGKKEYIQMMRKNQMTRALRVDKFTLAALERTMALYLDEEKVLSEIPTLAMITESKENCLLEAQNLANEIRQLKLPLTVDVKVSAAAIGGGSYPEWTIPSTVVTLKSQQFSASQLEEQLRSQKIPIIGRISQEHYSLDIRTLQREDFTVILDALKNIFKPNTANQ